MEQATVKTWTDISKENYQSAFVKKHMKNVYNVAYYFLKNVEDAKDITQDCFFRFFKSIHLFDKTKDAGPWLYKIVKNLCFNKLKKKIPGQIPDYNNIDSKTSNPEEDFIQKKEKSYILDCLDKLSENAKEIIVLKYFNHLSYKDMAEALNCPIGTIMSRLYYARKELKDIYLKGVNHESK